jgi:hypothetical protein
MRMFLAQNVVISFGKREYIYSKMIEFAITVTYTRVKHCPSPNFSCGRFYAPNVIGSWKV